MQVGLADPRCAVLSHTLKVVHQLEDGRVTDGDLVRIDGQHSETGAVQKRANVTHLGERRYMRRETLVEESSGFSLTRDIAGTCF